MARRTKEEAAETYSGCRPARLFRKGIFPQTTFVDIAKEIGLSKGAVYWHFKTKTDLLAAIIQHGKEMKCGRIKDAGPTTVSEVRELIEGTAHRFKQKAGGKYSGTASAAMGFAGYDDVV